MLEPAVRCGPGFLLFATNDIPSEEMLEIHLVDKGGHLLDSARIGGPYSTGSFSALRLEPPSTARFRFIDLADWSVEVLDGPRLSMPYLPDAKGVWRGRGLRRHFVVHRSPASRHRLATGGAPCRRVRFAEPGPHGISIAA